MYLYNVYVAAFIRYNGLVLWWYTGQLKSVWCLTIGTQFSKGCILLYIL